MHDIYTIKKIANEPEEYGPSHKRPDPSITPEKRPSPSERSTHWLPKLIVSGLALGILALAVSVCFSIASNQIEHPAYGRNASPFVVQDPESSELLKLIPDADRVDSLIP